MRRTTLVLALIAALAPTHARADAACAPGSDGGDWPVYGGDYANSRHQAAEDLIGRSNAGSLAPRWILDRQVAGATGSFDGTPVVADGCVYSGTNGGWVFALNADTGDLVWKTQLDAGVYSSLHVADGKVFANMAQTSSFSTGPRTAALDQATGRVLWQTEVSDHLGSDLYGSPVSFDGMVFTGIGANSIEGDHTFRGSFVLLDADTGALIERTWTIPPSVWHLGYSGAGVWTTPAIDTETRYAYIGTGNPFNSRLEHGNSNALLKVDLDRSRPTFGEIVAAYKGQNDQYVYTPYNRTSCEAADLIDANQTQRFVLCEMLDIDFGASPNLLEFGGRKVVGALQKSGVYHTAEADSLGPIWQRVVGLPIIITGGVSTAYDGESIYGSYSPPGWAFSLDKDLGDLRYLTPMTNVDARHYEPSAIANGVHYTLDGNGVLHGFDSDTGVPLLVRPMAQDTGTTVNTQGGGVSIARHTVYANAGRFLIAYGV